MSTGRELRRMEGRKEGWMERKERMDGKDADDDVTDKRKKEKFVIRQTGRRAGGQVGRKEGRKDKVR